LFRKMPVSLLSYHSVSIVHKSNKINVEFFLFEKRKEPPLTESSTLFISFYSFLPP